MSSAIKSRIAFNAETKEGYAFKALIEFLSAYFTNIQPIITSDGIKIYCMDVGVTHSFIINLNASNFINYSCPNHLEIGINTTSLYCLLKRVKKKDSLALTIMSDAPDEMIIRIYQTDNIPAEGRDILRIVRAQSTEVEVPQDYPEPINISGKLFQNDMKELKDVGQIVEISTDDEGFTVKFSSSESGMYAREKVYGNKMLSHSERKQNIVSRHYNISMFITLSKIIGLSHLVSLYVIGGRPLRIDFRLGNLGIISAYIKSKEEISAEEADVDEKETPLGV